MDSLKQWGGYRIPEGMTSADVQRCEEELLATEGIDLLSGFEDEESQEEEPPQEEE